MNGVVVYVHGLWLNGWEAVVLRRRLGAALGAETRSFVYSSVGESLAANAAALGGYLSRIEAQTVHVVAHSLGGLVTLALFESWGGGEACGTAARGALAPGRIVLLGSPVCGSQTARRLARLPLGRRMLGATARDALLQTRECRWAGARELGVIAGDLPVGLGRVLGPMGAPSDGTVLVSETRVAGATDELTLPVSHAGLPYAASVVAATAAFLSTGRFTRGS